jgi:hypothetical protein
MKVLCWLAIAGILAWAVRIVVRVPTASRIIGLTGMAVFFGVLAGFQLSWSFYLPVFRDTLGKAITSIDNEHYFASMVSFGVLKQLEAGKDDAARSMLATQVVGYYRGAKKAKTPTEEQRKIIPLVEEASKTSEILKAKLQEPQK